MNVSRSPCNLLWSPVWLGVCFGSGFIRGPANASVQFLEFQKNIQALEVKAHSLVMADVYSAIRPLITRTLLPTDFCGHIAVVNPYYSLILASLRLVKTNPRYANVDLLSGVPTKWRDRRPIDTYRVAAMERTGEGGEEEQGIGIGLFHAPSVPAFDFSDVI